MEFIAGLPCPGCESEQLVLTDEGPMECLACGKVIQRAIGIDVAE